MAFAGYLLKINGTVFPGTYILRDTWNTNPDQIQDDDSFIDGDGVLDRDILPHTRSKIEFSTVPYLNLNEKMAMQEILPTSRTERIRVTAQYWNDDTNEYKTGYFYIPDINYPIYDTTDTDILYNSIRVALIEY